MKGKQGIMQASLHAGTYLRQGEALESVLLEGRVHVLVQQIERDTEVVAKHKPLFDVDEVVVVAPVVLFQHLEHLDLDLRLLVEPTLIADYLDGSMLFCFVVKGLDNVTKRALA